jgi:hypothetical protein
MADGGQGRGRRAAKNVMRLTHGSRDMANSGLRGAWVVGSDFRSDCYCGRFLGENFLLRRSTFALTPRGGGSRTPLPTTTNPPRFGPLGLLFQNCIMKWKGYVGGALRSWLRDWDGLEMNLRV